jgi:hypothetical protein
MEDSRLQYTGPQTPKTDADLIKMQIVKALSHLLREGELKPTTMNDVLQGMEAWPLLQVPVRMDISLNFTVETTVYPFSYEDSTEEEQLDDLLTNVVHHPEVLTKEVSTHVTGALDLSGAQQIGDVTLEVRRVYDNPEAIAATVYATTEVPADWPLDTEHQQQIPMTYRDSGLPTILDADSDPFNRVLGMEFTIEEHSFKAAFTNSHGTVIHLYEKVGRKWRPLCDRANAKGPNGISIQSNRDHRTWCTQCENKYANKQAD